MPKEFSMPSAPSLLELQRAFAAAVTGETEDELTPWIEGRGLAPEARLRVYRNIVSIGHTEALRAAYPVVCRLVGDDFFEGVAVRYLRDVASASGNLQDYGAAFPAFLADLPEAAGVAYLADVAQLEWARQEAYLAADAIPIDRAAFTAVEETDYARLTLNLHPSVRLVRSPYPVFDIWLFCQEDASDDLQLAESGQNVLIRRADAQLAMQALEPGSAAFVAALLANQTLNRALEAASEADATFDLAACLQGLFEMHVVTGYSIEAGKKQT